ncbi:MAG: AlkA N-terminal domain-containing protein [Terrimesophilobacter sp.]
MPHTRLTTTTPFDGRGLMKYFAGHAVPGIESGDEEHYRRNLRESDGSLSKLEVILDGIDGILASRNGSTLSPSQMRDVRKLFDLNADSVAIDAHLSSDPVLAEVVAANPGIRLPGSLDAHEQLLRTMIGQQISVPAARTTIARLARELDGTGLFPTAKQFAENGLDVLRGPAARIAAVHGVAVALCSGTLALPPDLDQPKLTNDLVAMPGVGPWTAGYVAMRVLGAPDVLLSSDLVLLKGAAKLGLPATPRGIADYARRWAPYRSYAGLHLWRVAQQP